MQWKLEWHGDVGVQQTTTVPDLSHLVFALCKLLSKMSLQQLSWVCCYDAEKSNSNISLEVLQKVMPTQMFPFENTMLLSHQHIQDGAGMVLCHVS